MKDVNVGCVYDCVKMLTFQHQSCAHHAILFVFHEASVGTYMKCLYFVCHECFQTKKQIVEDLELFLGSQNVDFTDW